MLKTPSPRNGIVRGLEACMTRLGYNKGNTVYSRSKGCCSTDLCLPYIAQGRSAGNRLFHVLLALAPTPHWGSGDFIAGLQVLAAALLRQPCHSYCLPDQC